MLNAKKLFTKILRKLTDSGETSLTSEIRYRVKNGIVFIDCYIPGTITINTTYKVLATLPAGLAPPTTFYGNAGTNNANTGVFYIANDGKIGGKTFTGSTTYFWFQTSYPITD